MRISGVGCGLYDYLYKNISFSSPGFKQFKSRKAGDGGIMPGELVFAESLSQFMNLPIETCIKNLTSSKTADTVNLGGPALVSLIHASQVLNNNYDICYYSTLGTDFGSDQFIRDISRFPLKFHYNRIPDGFVPSTIVLSDPSWHDGAGERTFINTQGSALSFSLNILDDAFFSSDFCLWGGTALVPPLHDNLGQLTKEVKTRGGFNLVGTVYDFRNQIKDPEGRWPLGSHSDPAYPWIDLLITDKEEAYQLSGRNSIQEAAEYFLAQGCGACVITQGRDSVYVTIGSDCFRKNQNKNYPVCEWINADLQMNPEKKGDTTGCGDNFMAGVLVSLAKQSTENPDAPFDLDEAVIEGICSGGFALYTVGGVHRETMPGEKQRCIDEIKKHYRKQIS